MVNYKLVVCVSNCTSEKSRAFVDLTATDGPIVIDAEEIVPPIQE